MLVSKLKQLGFYFLRTSVAKLVDQYSFFHAWLTKAMEFSCREIHHQRGRGTWESRIKLISNSRMLVVSAHVGSGWDGAGRKRPGFANT